MGRPEIMRSGEVSLGDNPAGNEVDEKQEQPTEGMGPVPADNDADHPADERPDPDKPFDKFAARAASERDAGEGDDPDPS